MVEEEGGRRTELVRKFLKVNCNFLCIEWSVWTQECLTGTDTSERGRRVSLSVHLLVFRK